MSTPAFREWDRLGRNYRLAKPIAELEAWARRNGIPVLGTIGNDAHLEKDDPEDHTPFSKTAWPAPLPGYYVCAIDLGNVRGLGAAIEAGARQGRYPWLKYMNHSHQHLDSRDLDGDGRRWEEYPSSDEHVHLSIRSDWIEKSIGDFDPFEDDMPTIDEFKKAVKEVVHGELPRRPEIGLNGDTLPGILANTFNGVGRVEKALAQLPVALAEAIVAKLPPAPPGTLTVADVEAAIRRVLKAGVDAT